MQLMTVVPVRLKELRKEGEQGRKKIPRSPRWLTVALGALQAYGLTVLFSSSTVGVLTNPSPGTIISIIVTLTAGTVVLMWLGEPVTEHGGGNGGALGIFRRIIRPMPGTPPSDRTTP